jgi:hypothetical protein
MHVFDIVILFVVFPVTYFILMLTVVLDERGIASTTPSNPKGDDTGKKKDDKTTKSKQDPSQHLSEYMWNIDPFFG